MEPPVAESAITTAAATAPIVAETSTEPVMTDRANTEASTAASGATEPAAMADSRGGTATEATPAGPASGQSGGKRVRWTRESIIDELARWMVTGTALDASFVKRNGPPGLVPAAIRVFGRFDAALNVAGLHVAKLYPAGPPASDSFDAKRPRRPMSGAVARRGRDARASSPQRQTTEQGMSAASDSRRAAVVTAEDPSGEPAR